MTLSILIRTRPDIWTRGLTLATALTNYKYVRKSPLPDGRIYACGGAYMPTMPIHTTPEQIEKNRIDRVQREIMEIDEVINDLTIGINKNKERIKNAKIEISRLRKEREEKAESILKASVAALSVAVPDGAMEWLLHEVGHFIAASPEERMLPNYGLSELEYGHDGEREWQAWAFEEIVLAPFGPSRLFAPPSQRDGAAYGKSGPIPSPYLRHIERQILALGIDIERWRVEWGEWVRWGASMGDAAPWRSAN